MQKPPLLILGEHQKNAVKVNAKLKFLLVRLNKEERVHFASCKKQRKVSYVEIDTKIRYTDFLEFFGNPNEVVREEIFHNVYLLSLYYITKAITYRFLFVGADAPTTKKGQVYLNIVNHGCHEYYLTALKLIFNGKSKK